MYSSFARTQYVFVLALGLTLLAAFAPARFLSWTTDLAEIVRMPLRPFSHVGIKLAHWVRPPMLLGPLEVPEEAREYVDHLTREVEKYKQLYAAEQMEVDSLRSELEQLQQVPKDLRRPMRLVSASIIARTPSDILGPVQLNRGSTVGVTAGTIALYDGVHLVGRVADVTLVGATLRPLARFSSSLCRAATETSWRMWMPRSA
jgi:cell shape-determining protein MreC